MKTNLTDTGFLTSLLAGCALLIGLGSSPLARADLSAPDTVVYGIIVLGTNQVTANATAFAVEARRTSGLLVARYRMGDRSDAGNYYVLAIKVEEIAPCRDAASVLLNETLAILVASNGVEQARQTFAVAERGQLKQLDFGTLPTNALSGFAAWAAARGLGGSSPTLDSDGDGRSNFDEYVAGTDPTNANSAFRLSVATSNAHAVVSFLALRAEGLGYEGSSRHYSLESTTNGAFTPWLPLIGYTDVVGNNQTGAYISPATNKVATFIRGRVELRSP